MKKLYYLLTLILALSLIAACSNDAGNSEPSEEVVPEEVEDKTPDSSGEDIDEEDNSKDENETGLVPDVIPGESELKELEILSETRTFETAEGPMTLNGVYEVIDEDDLDILRKSDFKYVNESIDYNVTYLIMDYSIKGGYFVDLEQTIWLSNRTIPRYFNPDDEGTLDVGLLVKEIVEDHEEELNQVADKYGFVADIGDKKVQEFLTSDDGSRIRVLYRVILEKHEQLKQGGYASDDPLYLLIRKPLVIDGEDTRTEEERRHIIEVKKN
ncbi:hypothetical protein [Robertmurraya massiliosenegalensis]|uniref:hypothetical protein n=1 Tax=Robertmurraya massiliosenegalensis TaxID=1287657 RepID=UPI0002E7D42C|nr:hypothetical protein [Robertmurraya massiliosenegalensis]